MIRSSLAALVGATAVLVAQSAQAYDYKTHGRMSEVAVAIMNDAASPTFDASPPGGVDVARWNLFIAKVRAAGGQLNRLRTGFPHALPRELSSDTAPFPFASSPTALPCNVPSNLALNLDRADALRIGTLASWGNLRPHRNADPCGIDLPYYESYLSSLGETLAWHAGAVDDDIGDTQVWSKPTHWLFAGWVESIESKVWSNVVGAALLPFACVWEAIFGDGCDVDDSFNAASKVNPVQYVENLIPGIPIARDSDYVGLWHFVDVDASGDFNTPRGMFYENAGPLGVPGAVDVGIMVGSDLLGFSIEADESYGVRKYADPYDEYSRNGAQWQMTTLGHTEFAPLNHLAQFGWDRFSGSGYTSAEGLGWPLHAIGDAVEPHHVAGTTSWGHRPFEDWTDEAIDGLMPLYLLAGEDEANRREILVQAFRYWNALEEGMGISDFIVHLAIETKSIAMDNYLDCYSDSSSIWYQMKDGHRAYAIDSFSTSKPTVTMLLKKGTGATLGFLVFASEKVVDLGDAAEGFCPTGQAYTPGLGCQSYPFTFSFGTLPLGACPASTSCTPGPTPCPEGTLPSTDYEGVPACCPPDIGSCHGVCCTDPLKPVCDIVTKQCTYKTIIR